MSSINALVGDSELLLLLFGYDEFIYWLIGLFACRFTANDGKMKLKAMFPSSFSSEINSGNIQNLGLIQVIDYTLNDIPSKQEK